MENQIVFQMPRFAFQHAGHTTVLYFVQSGRFLKIGITGDIDKRLTAIECGNPHGVKLAAFLLVPKSLGFQVERKVHAALHAVWHAGEWFEVDVAEAVRVAQTILPAAFARDDEWAAAAKLSKSQSKAEMLRQAAEHAGNLAAAIFTA